MSNTSEACRLYTRATIPEIIFIEPNGRDVETGFGFEMSAWGHRLENDVPATFVQDVQFDVARDALRGLHASRRHPVGKLVSVVEGEIFNVAVDIRRGSPSFGQWVGAWQSAENGRQCYVPPGFAQGFCVASEAARVRYDYTAHYDPSDEIHLLWNDPELGIAWPVDYPKLSDQDRSALMWRELLRWFPAYAGELAFA